MNYDTSKYYSYSLWMLLPQHIFKKVQLFVSQQIVDFHQVILLRELIIQEQTKHQQNEFNIYVSQH